MAVIEIVLLQPPAVFEGATRQISYIHEHLVSSTGPSSIEFSCLHYDSAYRTRLPAPSLRRLFDVDDWRLE